MKFESKYKFFVHENTSENIVCEMAAILSGGHASIYMKNNSGMG